MKETKFYQIYQKTYKDQIMEKYLKGKLYEKQKKNYYVIKKK